MDIVPKKKWRYPLAIEREYAKYLVAYIEKEMAIVESFIPEMADSLYRNGIRTDGIGDWLGNLVDRVKRKVTEKLSVVPVIGRIFQQTNRHVNQQMAELTDSVFGARPRQFKTRELEMTKTIWSSQNLTLIKSIDQQIMDKVRFYLSQRIIRTADKEKTIAELTQEIRDITGAAKKRATLIAVDQVGKLHSQLSQYRQMNAGIERYIWVTMLDSRVRPKHRPRHGVSYRWDSPPDDGHPGWPIRCRCVAQPVYNLDSFKLTPKSNSFTNNQRQGIMAVDIDGIGEAHIPIAKVVGYALDPEKAPEKAKAFKDALGYEKQHASELLQNIEKHINQYSLVSNGNDGYGDKFYVRMELVGRNGKRAWVLAAWMDDKKTGEFRLTSLYVDKKKGGG
ncbi:MAG: minor capsid protein [Selenomonadaceae bacterium]|nr:minor capsid protein [Selenomonadaceae bacterium]